jgi:glutamate---cysteine ligase / carboxylate-amine ligase
MAHAYRFGIEEEFFLADARSRGTPRAGLRGFHAAVRARVPDAEREQLRSQIEIASPPTADATQAEAHLRASRRALAEIGHEHGILPFAAGTHPTARWREQRETDKARYHGIMDELRMLGQRNLVCGLHVHVEVPDPDARVDLINRLLPFMPVLLALSTSSPFWQGRATGLSGYRRRAYAELPRTGLPELFADAADYERYVRIMVATGAIRDASFLWWLLRASIRYPTVELRVADSCPRLADALCVAALFRCLVRRLVREKRLNAGLTAASRGLILENLWRAERDGVHAELIDEARERAVPLAEAVEALVAETGEDAEALACAGHCAHARTIAAEGSSADRQLAAFAAARRSGMRERDALSAVVDQLARETAAGPEGASAGVGGPGPAWGGGRARPGGRAGRLPGTRPRPRSHGVGAGACLPRPGRCSRGLRHARVHGVRTRSALRALHRETPHGSFTGMSIETMHTLRKAPEASPLFAELSVVATLRDLQTDDGLTVPAGSRGTIVEVYASGAAYEVEFARPVVGNATVMADALTFP